MLYSFSDSSWTRSGQDNILVTVHRAQWLAAGFGIVTYHTHSLFPPQPQVFDEEQWGCGQKSMGLGNQEGALAQKPLRTCS